MVRMSWTSLTLVHRSMQTGLQTLPLCRFMLKTVNSSWVCYTHCKSLLDKCNVWYWAKQIQFDCIISALQCLNRQLYTSGRNVLSNEVRVLNITQLMSFTVCSACVNIKEGFHPSHSILFTVISTHQRNSLQLTGGLLHAPAPPVRTGNFAGENHFFSIHFCYPCPLMRSV